MTKLYLYNLMFRWHFRFGFDFNFLRPGYEVKQACDAAERVGARLRFLGPELDQRTWQRLAHETRMNVPQYLLRRLQYAWGPYSDERRDNASKVALAGPAAFTETCLDQHLVNWYIANTDIFFPQLKRHIVDKRDEELF